MRKIGGVLLAAAVLALHADYSLTAPAMEEGEDFV